MQVDTSTLVTRDRQHSIQ